MGFFSLLSHLHGGSRYAVNTLQDYLLLSHLHGGSLERFQYNSLFMVIFPVFSCLNLRFLSVLSTC